MLQTTLTIMLNCLSYIHYVQHPILFIPAYHYSDECNNFLVCHLLCFMFNHLKHNLKVVQDCITCRYKHVIVHVDLLLSCNAYKINPFRCLIYMYVNTLWAIQIFTTLTYSEIIINVTSLLDIISQLSLNDRLTVSNHTHALHRSTLHNKFIQLIRSKFVKFYLNENTTLCINESLCISGLVFCLRVIIMHAKYVPYPKRKNMSTLIIVIFTLSTYLLNELLIIIYFQHSSNRINFNFPKKYNIRFQNSEILYSITTTVVLIDYYILKFKSKTFWVLYVHLWYFIVVMGSICITSYRHTSSFYLILIYKTILSFNNFYIRLMCNFFHNNISTNYIRNCSNYHLIVFTWNLEPVHLDVGLENTRLTIAYTITILLIYHKTQGYLCFNESSKFLCDNVHNYNRIQQFVSNYCLDASIYHLRKFGNQYVNHIVQCMLRYISIACEHNYVIRTMLLVITQTLLLVLHRVLRLLLYCYCTAYCIMHLHDPCIDFRDTSDKFKYCHTNYINPSNSEINPLTTNHFFKLPFNSTITIFPVIRHTFDFPFNNIADHELEPIQQFEELNVHNHANVDSLINEDKFDHSELAKVDPDTNFLTQNRHSTCDYYNDLSFNENFHRHDNLSLFHVNIRSLPRNFDHLKIHLNELKHSFTIIAISENWLTNINREIYHLKGYSHKNTIREQRTGGGVSLFIKNDINFQVRDNININLPDVDSLFIEIPKEELHSNKNIFVGVCYRPPHVCIRKFTEELTSLLEQLHALNKHIYLLGDFNVNTLRTSTGLNSRANEFSNLFLSYFFQPLIDKPTRVVNDSISLLDNIYTNVTHSGDICTSGVMKTDFSDHYSIFTFSNHKITPNITKAITRREFSERNKAKFCKALHNTSWDLLYSIEDAHDAFEYFHSVIQDLFEENFPPHNIKLNYSNKLPWITKGLRVSIKQKHILKNILEKNPTADNKMNYKRHRNALTSLMRTTERRYNEDQLELYKNDLRKVWKIMKEVIGKTNDSRKQDLEMFVDGSISKDPKTIVNAFNDYFVDIGPQLASRINSDVNPMSYISADSKKSIFIPYVTEYEITSILSGINNSSPGWDNIPSVILKPFIKEYIKPLTYVINKSFETGKFPNLLKIAKIIPIFKSGDKTRVSNYRPISVLPVFAKVYEKIMANHLLEFLNSNNTLYKLQFGFRKHFSTSHAIISLVEKINKAISSDKYMIGVFLDFRKAYDTVNHSILLKKLYKYGIRGHILNWFKSYLTERQQFVSVNNNYSSKKCITCGIPQGSVLGPLLFLIYINDLPNASKKLFSILFADDTSVFMEHTNLDHLSDMLNIELNKLSIWLASNKLTLNIDKSHFVIFHRARLKQNNVNISLCDIALNRVTFTKFLGVIIDDKLSFSRHVSYIKNKISKGMGIIIKARKYLNKKSLLDLYHAFVYPYLTYCIEVWGNMSNVHLDALVKIQKKIVRIITYSPYLAHTDELFKDLNILPIHKLMLQRVSLQMFKYSRNTLPEVISELFITNDTFHSHNTRNKNKLRSKMSNREYMYKNFSFIGVYIWNDIQDHIPINTSYSKFKSNTKNYFQYNNINYRIA